MRSISFCQVLLAKILSYHIIFLALINQTDYVLHMALLLMCIWRRRRMFIDKVGRADNRHASGKKVNISSKKSNNIEKNVHKSSDMVRSAVTGWTRNEIIICKRCIGPSRISISLWLHFFFFFFFLLVVRN